MDILEKLNSVSITFTLDNLLVVILILIILIFVITKLSQKIVKIIKGKIKVRQITINGISFDIECNNDVKKLAEEVWVELATRKIALPFDEKNDVIEEVYNSWYTIFEKFREILKRIPVEKSSSVDKLTQVILATLNGKLRAHLTKWQARFRKWYETNKNQDGDPQDIQKRYPQYNELINDLKIVNNEMMKLTDELDKIRKDE